MFELPGVTTVDFDTDSLALARLNHLTRGGFDTDSLALARLNHQK